MTFEDLRASMIESFNRGIFPEPIEFSDLQIEAIATTPGFDLNGTFADTPMERLLMRRYDLDADYGENTWPALASSLHRQKLERLEILNSERKYALLLDKFNEARSNVARLKALGKAYGYGD
jgi:hypothetical protein